MGFGPKASDPESGAQAVVDVVTTLYPEHSTTTCLTVLKNLAETLLSARAVLSFDSMAKFLQDPDWRQDILARASNPGTSWDAWVGEPIAPESLDPNFAWLLQDRLSAMREDP